MVSSITGSTFTPPSTSAAEVVLTNIKESITGITNFSFIIPSPIVHPQPNVYSLVPYLLIH